MAGKVWGIKLGSGGSCVAFCEPHAIVGVGWPVVEAAKVAAASREEF